MEKLKTRTKRFKYFGLITILVLVLIFGSTNIVWAQMGGGGDVNGDGVVDYEDVQTFVGGMTDIFDWPTLVANFGPQCNECLEFRIISLNSLNSMKRGVVDILMSDEGVISSVLLEVNDIDEVVKAESLRIPLDDTKCWYCTKMRCEKVEWMAM